MNYLEHFITLKNNNKMDDLIKKASQLECNTLDTKSFMHQTLHKIKDTFFSKKMKDSLQIYQCIVEVEKYFKYTPNVKNDYYYSNIFKELDCGVYRYIHKNYYWHYEYLIPNISESMDKNKIIFIILDFQDYGLDMNNDYEAHSTVLLFLPENNKKKYFDYNCYYINSHGINSLDDTFYEYRLSSKRKKKCKLNKPFDFKFIEMLVHYLNKNLTHKIKYNNKHNYLGVNFQLEDSRGVCFMYPIVIFYYFGKNYLNQWILKTQKENIKIKSGQDLIKNGQLDLFIESMFMDFCPEFKIILIEKIKYPNTDYRDFLTEILQKKKLLFCKVILRAMVKFITQFK